jgi:hypothetical protein
MQADEISYCLARFEDEVVAADAASCHEARVAHLELALRYSMMARSADTPVAASIQQAAAALSDCSPPERSPS